MRWPAVSVDLVRDPDFVLANLAGFCLCVARIVPALVLSLWFQGFVGDSPMVGSSEDHAAGGRRDRGDAGSSVGSAAMSMTCPSPRTCAVGSVTWAAR